MAEKCLLLGFYDVSNLINGQVLKEAFTQTINNFSFKNFAVVFDIWINFTVWFSHQFLLVASKLFSENFGILAGHSFLGFHLEIAMIDWWDFDMDKNTFRCQNWTCVKIDQNRSYIHFTYWTNTYYSHLSSYLSIFN